VTYSEAAEEQIEAYTKAGYAHLPVCIAKTQYRCVCHGGGGSQVGGRFVGSFVIWLVGGLIGWVWVCRHG
jgi:hypothetical protein